MEKEMKVMSHKLGLLMGCLLIVCLVACLEYTHEAGFKRGQIGALTQTDIQYQSVTNSTVTVEWKRIKK